MKHDFEERRKNQKNKSFALNFPKNSKTDRKKYHK